MRLLAFALLLSLAACRNAAPTDGVDTSGTPGVPGNPQQACTMEFRTYGVTLLGSAGQPVTDARMEMRRADGTSVLCRFDADRNCLRPADVQAYGAPGTYTIMTDGVPVNTAGETFTATLTAPSGQAAAGTYRFSYDGCHVRKLSGADTLRLR